jgi:hypothetical protein
MELLIKRLHNDKNCTVYSPTGLPQVGIDLPEDLKYFYSVCGGAEIFYERDYGVKIVSPDEFVKANIEICGEDYLDDRSTHWFVIAKTNNNESLVIDLERSRLGRCYDGFFDVYGVAGSQKIIATSFCELLNSLIHNKGEYWYWLRDDFSYLGDAYD